MRLNVRFWKLAQKQISKENGPSLKKKKKRLFSCFEGENIHCEICGILGKAKFDVIISKVTTSTASNFIKNWITR